MVIQRIQTLFLVLSSLALASVFQVPLLHLISDADTYKLSPVFGFVGMESMELTPLLPIPYFIALLCNVVAIFLFKNFNIQRLFCRLTIVFNLILIGASLFYTNEFIATQPNLNLDQPWGLVVVGSSIFLLMFAIRAITKDEKLLKSVDRIR